MFTEFDKEIPDYDAKHTEEDAYYERQRQAEIEAYYEYQKRAPLEAYRERKKQAKRGADPRDKSKESLYDAAKITNDYLHNPSSIENIKLGTIMKDGTYYIGVSSKTGKPVYAAPKDSPTSMDFNEAAEYTKNLAAGGKTGFRIPERAELDLMAESMAQNHEMEKTFDLYIGEYYWSCTSYKVALGTNAILVKRMADGMVCGAVKTAQCFVRAVRG